MPKDHEIAENQRDAGAEYGIPIAGMAPIQHGLPELWGAMRGRVVVIPETDLTRPAGEVWEANQ
jgi:hypothetical protein